MVYVDNMNTRTGDWIMCNLVADAEDELFAMAEVCKLKKEWVTNEPYRRLSFPVSLSKKKIAIANGAMEISIVELMMRFPVPLDVPDKDLNLAELDVRYRDVTFEGFTDRDCTVIVDGITYRIPLYLFTDWFGRSWEYVRIDTVKESIKSESGKFESFILYGTL